jgi:hypothetical protein
MTDEARQRVERMIDGFDRTIAVFGSRDDDPVRLKADALRALLAQVDQLTRERDEDRRVFLSANTKAVDVLLAETAELEAKLSAAIARAEQAEAESAAIVARLAEALSSPAPEGETQWRCGSCGEVIPMGDYLKIANQKGELSHGKWDGGSSCECGPVAVSPTPVDVRVRTGRETLIAALERMADRYDMTATERYEADSDAFYLTTGYMAPGKDVPMAMGGQGDKERRAAQEHWIAGRNALQQAILRDAADALRAAPAPTQESHHHYQPSTSDANICAICGDGPWGIHRFQPTRAECRVCTPEKETPK